MARVPGSSTPPMRSGATAAGFMERFTVEHVSRVEQAEGVVFRKVLSTGVSGHRELVRPLFHVLLVLRLFDPNGVELVSRVEHGEYSPSGQRCQPRADAGRIVGHVRILGYRRGIRA